MYFASKLLAEKAAMEATKENNIDFICIIPPVVVGPFIMPTLPPSLITALSPITGDANFHLLQVYIYRSTHVYLIGTNTCSVVNLDWSGNKPHYSIIKQGQFVHIDDLCEAHIFLFEDQRALGRYICSSHDATIYDLAQMLRDNWPEYDIPTE